MNRPMLAMARAGVAGALLGLVTAACGTRHPSGATAASSRPAISTGTPSTAAPTASTQPTATGPTASTQPTAAGPTASTQPTATFTTTARPTSTTTAPIPTTTTTTVRPTTTTAPGPTTTAAPSSVTATETEYHIALSTNSFHSGPYVFTAVNQGHAVHNLVISGGGTTQQTPDLAPGQSASLSITLRPGSYEIYCGIPGHRDAGMDVAIQVG